MMRTTLATSLIVLLMSVVYAQTPATVYAQTPATTESDDMPVFRVQVVGFIVQDFTSRVTTYYELRRRLEEGLPPLTLTDHPDEIRVAQRLLARRIRMARQEAREGEIFNKATTQEFKRVLRLELDKHTREAIADDNPGSFAHDINDSYPIGRPFSTMPGAILKALPELPADLQYRFLGRHLILLDTRANVILDRITCAIRCPKL